MTAENEKGEIERYQVDEFYRMRYDQTRIRLLDFHRSAKQVLTTEQSVVTAVSYTHLNRYKQKRKTYNSYSPVI